MTKNYLLHHAIMLALVFGSVVLKAQSRLDSLKTLYENSKTDSARLYYAIEVNGELLEKNPVRSMSYLKFAKSHLEKEEIRVSRDSAYLLSTRYAIFHNAATAYSYLGDPRSSVSNAIEALKVAQILNDKEKESGSLNNLATKHQELGNYEEALRYYKQSLEIALVQNDHFGIGLITGNIGSLYGSWDKDSSYQDSAVAYYKKSLPYLEKIEGREKFGALGWMMNNIGCHYFGEGKLDSALFYFNKSLKYREGIDHFLGQLLVHRDIATLYLARGKYAEAKRHINRSINIALQDGFKGGIGDSYLLRSEILEKTGEYIQALSDYRLGIALRDSVQNVENSRMAMRQSLQYEYGKKQIADSIVFANSAEIQDLELQKKEAILVKQRIALGSTAGGLVLIIALAFSVYRGKQRSEKLLLNILPTETARELKKRGRAEAKHFEKVTVLFTDFKDFTPLTERLEPRELVAAIDECFQAFDRIMQKYGIEKIKTIGDSYMAAGGLAKADRTNAAEVVLAALEMRDFIVAHRKKKQETAFEMRIGIHTGPVVAGVVGIKKFQYDIWGDTVNTASRMESHGEVGKVNISQSTYELIKDDPLFRFEPRGKVEAKGKGGVEMYFTFSNEEVEIEQPTT